MNLLKSVLSAIALGSLALAGPALAQNKPTVGIAMPTKSSARWIDDGNNIVKVLKERGYNTDLQYAEDDIPNQLSQIENMVTKGAKVLVIAAIDGTTLSDVLKQAKDKGITVIAYDRLIRDTPNVDYYATFDNFQVGVLQAQSIEQGLKLREGQGPFQHRAVRRITRRQQRLLLLQRRDVGTATLYRQRQARGRQPPNRYGQGLDVALGWRHGAGPHG
jgi:putative multiple sugar transport system substrate-binding protein